MKRILFILMVLAVHNVKGQNWSEPQKLKVSIDCSSCDINFFSQKMDYISLVRDQKSADVHVIVRTQITGSGGVQYELEFYGQGNYKHLFNRITFSTTPMNTQVETRELMLDNLIISLTVFWTQQSKDWNDPTKANKDTTSVAPSIITLKDPWNKWVFNIGANGNVSGEESSELTNYGFNFSMKKVTEKNKFFFRGSFNKNKSKFTFGETTINSTNRAANLTMSNAFSIAKHWSVAGFFEMGNSDYNNLSWYTTFKPAVEYSVFTYEEASKKQIKLSYRIGGLNNEYNDKTIFNKNKEFLWEHSINLGGSLQQKWGSLSGEANYSSYLHDTALHALQFKVGSNFRVFEGLSFNVNTNYSITNNQINLAGGDLTLDELLLRQKQVKSGYRFMVALGFNYAFGSIYSAIVNPRFGF